MSAMTGKCKACGRENRLLRDNEMRQELPYRFMGDSRYFRCMECIDKRLVPYDVAVSFIARGGARAEDAATDYEADIRRMLPLWGKTLDELIADIDKRANGTERFVDKWNALGRTNPMSMNDFAKAYADCKAADKEEGIERGAFI